MEACLISSVEKGVVINRHVRYLLLSCQELYKLDLSENWKKKIVRLLEKNNVGKMKPSDVCVQGYVKRKLEQINIDPSGELPREQFMGAPFKGMK
jgi:hypothetical protein